MKHPDNSLARKWYENCTVCPHRCGVDRLEGETGVCGADDGIYAAGVNLHYGEEPVLVGRGGSGTIFFSSCNLKCVFCQNYDISMCKSPAEAGRYSAGGELQRLMWNLEVRGAENINLVTPTHMGPAVFDEVRAARAGGLRLPVVYNCGGYESVEFLREIEGLVDVYMPDIKFGSDEAGARYTTAQDYFSRCREAVREMHRQVGDLETGPRGTARCGLLVRHLVMPGGTAAGAAFSPAAGPAAGTAENASDSKRVIDFIVDEISTHTYMNVMDQYRPAYRAGNYPGIGRRVTLEEYDEVRRYAESRGLTRFAD